MRSAGAAASAGLAAAGAAPGAAAAAGGAGAVAGAGLAAGALAGAAQPPSASSRITAAIGERQREAFIWWLPGRPYGIAWRHTRTIPGIPGLCAAAQARHRRALRHARRFPAMVVIE